VRTGRQAADAESPFAVGERRPAVLDVDADVLQRGAGAGVNDLAIQRQPRV
jgi:hypothetical protein